MKLGEMLVRDGRITEDQLYSAIGQQKRVGGRLGTVMVEMGLVDLDALTVYLGLELGIPIASGAALERAKKLAVRLLTPAQAAHYRCVPLLLHDRQLIAAIDDPHDMEALDELLRISGYRILPRVSPEIRIYYYLERYYGVARPPRFMVFGDSPRGNVKPALDLPAPPLPGLPPINVHKVTAPTPAPPLRSAPAEVEEDDYEELDLDDDDLLVELEADATDAASEAPLGSPEPRSTDSMAPALEAESYEAMDVDAAVAALAEAQGRNDIAKVLMSHAVSLFDLSALCIVRDNMAFGWKVAGNDLDYERIETLLIPLSIPSMFQSAVVEDDRMFTGPPFPGTLHNYLYKVLRCPVPPFAAVRVISIGKRVVNLLYGHRSSASPLDELDLEGLALVCKAASNAYIRMIASSKKGKIRARAESISTAPVDGDPDAPPFDDDETTAVGKLSARTDDD
jgi:hypothetical protein